MRITIEVEEGRATSQAAAQISTKPLESTDWTDGGAPSLELVEAIQGATAARGETSGGQTTNGASDGGAAPSA